MGKKRADLSNHFRESIDPRFNGIFNSNKNNHTGENSSNVLQPLANMVTECKHPKVSENVGFQNFLSTKLADFLDSHIKEVDRPVSEQEFFSNKQESIQLFSDSEAITEEQPIKSIQKKIEKKKRKKDRSDKELLKEVAVSFDWLQQQARILNS